MAKIVTTPDGAEHRFDNTATPEQIKRALAPYLERLRKLQVQGAGGGVPPEAMTPQEMFGPQAAARRWLRAIPFATGAGGALLGGRVAGPMGARLGGRMGAGIGVPVGEVLGAGMGGMAGGAAELGIAREPLTPKGLVEPGLEQMAWQAPASVLGPASKSLFALRELARNFAIRQAIKEANAPVLAGRAARVAAVAREAPEATRIRQAAAAATKAEIAAAPGEITVRDLAERIIDQRQSRFGVQVSPKVRAQIVNDVKLRVVQVLPTYTGRLISGKKLVFDMPTSQVGKQAFDDLVRAVHTGKEGGIRPKPNIDLDIADAWRALIEERVPAVAALNRATAGAIREEVGVKRLQKAIPTERAARIRMAERNAATAARVLAQRSWNPVRLVRAIPTQGSIAEPVIGYRPGTLAELAGKIGQVLAWPPLGPTAFYSPRALALLAELLQAPPEPRSRE